MNGQTILVVGAGITGLSAGEWLRRAGWQVTLIDPVMPGDPEQASFGNAGILARASVMPVASPSLVRKAPRMLFDPDSPLFLRWSYLPRLLPWLIPFLRNSRPARIREIAQGLSQMSYDTNEQHKALAQGTGAEAWITSGDYINLFRSAAEYHADTLWAEIRQRFNLETEPVERQELEARDPHLGPRYQFGARYRDFCWLKSPAAYMAALFDHYRREGGGFRQAKVVDITPGPQPSLTLDGGAQLSADKIVLSSGAWSSRLARQAGAPVNLDTERGYHLSMYAPSITAPHPYMVTDAKMVVTPMDGFLRAAGVVEFGGVDAPPSQAPERLIRDCIRKVYPDLEFERADAWMGRRPTTPDSLPVLGESPRAPGVIHAYGGQHIGLTIGPKLGRIVRDLVAGRSTNLDLSPYDPDRF